MINEGQRQTQPRRRIGRRTEEVGNEHAGAPQVRGLDVRQRQTQVARPDWVRPVEFPLIAQRLGALGRHPAWSLG
jgi:hypothetical protein